MKLRLFLGIFAAGISVLLPAHADPARQPRFVDVGTFDIAGVRLGMGYEEAVAAAAKHFQVPVKEIKAATRTGKLVETRLKDGTAVSKNEVTQTMLPESFWYFSKGEHDTRMTLSVSFSARIPVDKAQPLAVDYIEYTITGTNSERALREAVLNKYGAPTIESPLSGVMWCADSPLRRRHDTCPSDNASLELLGSILKLRDPSYGAAIKKYLYELKAMKPPKI
jgi:hypothetical protein